MLSKKADPTFTINVSDEEKAAAKEARRLFQEFDKKQEELIRYLNTFFDSLEATENTVNIQKIGPLLKKYIHKYRDLCNEYITAFEKAVQYLTCNFQDTDMSNIRDLIIESVRDIRDNSKELIITFKNIGDPQFVENIKKLNEKLKNRFEKLQNVINEELFGHIDYNIMGKIRLSFHDLPLSIKKSSSVKN